MLPNKRARWARAHNEENQAIKKVFWRLLEYQQRGTVTSATKCYGTTPSRAPALVAQQRSRKEPAHLSKPEFTAGCSVTGQAVTTQMGSFMYLQLENYNSAICQQGLACVWLGGRDRTIDYRLENTDCRL